MKIGEKSLVELERKKAAEWKRRALLAWGSGIRL